MAAPPASQRANARAIVAGGDCHVVAGLREQPTELSGDVRAIAGRPALPPLGRAHARAPAAGGGGPGARHRLRHRHRCPAGARTRRTRWRGRGSGRQPRHAGGGARRRTDHHLARRQRARPAAGRGRTLRRGDLPAGPAVLPRSHRRGPADAPRPGPRRPARGGDVAPGRRDPDVPCAAARGRTSSRTRRRSTARLRRRRPARQVAGGRRVRRRDGGHGHAPAAFRRRCRLRADEHDGFGRDVGRGQDDERRDACRHGRGHRRRQC